MNAIFGGTTLSKLFLNVREKLSLCYYASSAMEKMKGLILVSSGIEFDKFQTARDEILAQLEAIRRGEIEGLGAGGGEAHPHGGPPWPPWTTRGGRRSSGWARRPPAWTRPSRSCAPSLKA